LGEVLEANGRSDEARQAFLVAKAANPEFVTADLSLAELDVKAGRLDSARATLSTILSANPANTRAQFALGRVEAAKGNHAAAIQQYRKILEAEPSNVPALNNLASELGSHGDNLTEALQIAEKAKELAPYSADVSDTLGWLFYEKGLYALSLIQLERAVALQDSALYQAHLAMAYIKSGDRDRGRAALERAQKQSPSLPEVREAQELMDWPVTPSSATDQE
jgi:tetratricopeptide (TPR) repeat protein